MAAARTAEASRNRAVYRARRDFGKSGHEAQPHGRERVAFAEHAHGGNHGKIADFGKLLSRREPGFDSAAPRAYAPDVTGSA